MTYCETCGHGMCVCKHTAERMSDARDVIAVDIIAKRLCNWEDQFDWSEANAAPFRQEARFILSALNNAGLKVVLGRGPTEEATPPAVFATQAEHIAALESELVAEEILAAGLSEQVARAYQEIGDLQIELAALRNTLAAAMKVEAENQ